MKKLFFTVLAAIALGTTAFAGPLTVTPKMNEHFSGSFSKAKNATWKTNEQFAKVSFQLGKEKWDAFYGTDGELIGTSRAINFDKLPKSGLETITTRYTYPEYQIRDCIEFVNASNERNFYVSFDKAGETVVLEMTRAGVVSVFAK